MRTALVAALLAAAFALLDPERAAAQATQGVWTPSAAGGTGVYAGEPAVSRGPRTRGNPVYWVGCSLGFTGFLAGAGLLLFGALVTGFRDDAQDFVITGAIVLPAGTIPFVISAILVATDRITVDEDVELSFTLQPSSDGARGTLSLSF